MGGNMGAMGYKTCGFIGFWPGMAEGLTMIKHQDRWEPRICPGATGNLMASQVLHQLKVTLYPTRQVWQGRSWRACW